MRAIMPHRREPPVGRSLRERVYATVVTLVSLITLTDHIEDESSLSIAFSLWIMLIGLWTASMFADVAAHVATERSLPAGTRRWRCSVAGFAKHGRHQGLVTVAVVPPWAPLRGGSLRHGSCLQLKE